MDKWIIIRRKSTCLVVKAKQVCLLWRALPPFCICMVWALTDQKNLTLRKQRRVSQISTSMMKTKLYNTLWQDIKLECLKKKMTCESLELKTLWKHCLENESTGVIGNFSLKYATTVRVKPETKHSHGRKGQFRYTSCSTALTSLDGNNTCCNCGKSFLWKGKLMRHKENGSCCLKSKTIHVMKIQSKTKIMMGQYNHSFFPWCCNHCIKKTTQSLVNTLLSILWHNRLP